MKAIVTGITGQDGYYLSKLLLEKGYEVHGLIRRSSNINTARLDSLISKYSEDGKLNLYFSDLIDSSSLTNLINKILPDEIYNLAAQSHVAVSFKNPIYSTHTSTVGTVTILESIRNVDKNIKFYQASSSEMYGGEDKELLNENSLLKSFMKFIIDILASSKFLTTSLSSSNSSNSKRLFLISLILFISSIKSSCSVIITSKSSTLDKCNLFSEEQENKKSTAIIYLIINGFYVHQDYTVNLK